jgi:hypothetical protein
VYQRGEVSKFHAVVGMKFRVRSRVPAIFTSCFRRLPLKDGRMKDPKRKPRLWLVGLTDDTEYASVIGIQYINDHLLRRN